MAYKTNTGKYKVVLVRSKKNREYFWQIIHRNGREICRSSETYKRKSACEKSLYNMIDAIAMGQFVTYDADGAM